MKRLVSPRPVLLEDRAVEVITSFESADFRGIRRVATDYGSDRATRHEMS